MEASTRNFIALGERRGLPVRFIGKGFGKEGEAPEFKGCRSIAMNGFSLHADTFVKDRDRRSLEKLVRYTSRSSVSLERLERNKDGDIVYQLKRKWTNGKTHVLFSPYEFLEKLASLIPLPKKHLTRFSGVLAPHHKLRKKIVPKPSPETIAQCKLKNMEYELSPDERLKWAQLLKRVYDIDISVCPKCEGPMKITAAITDPEVIEKMLTCMGLPARPPPLGQITGHWIESWGEPSLADHEATDQSDSEIHLPAEPRVERLDESADADE
jgi:hypothetical protein